MQIVADHGFQQSIERRKVEMKSVRTERVRVEVAEGHENDGRHVNGRCLARVHLKEERKFLYTGTESAKIGNTPDLQGT